MRAVYQDSQFPAHEFQIDSGRGRDVQFLRRFLQAVLCSFISEISGEQRGFSSVLQHVGCLLNVVNDLRKRHALLLS